MHGMCYYDSQFAKRLMLSFERMTLFIAFTITESLAANYVAA